MTKEDIKNTINKMRATQGIKDVLQKECDKGNPHALFSVRGLAIRQKHQKPMMIKGKIRMTYVHPIQERGI